MADKTTDRRALRTQRLLKESLAELLADKELRKITVQEVSDKADVHRVTFYKHFLDVYDLYDRIKNEMLTELGMLILNLHGGMLREAGIKLTEYIEKNPKLFRMMFSPHNTLELRSGLTNMIAGVFRLSQSEKLPVSIMDDRLDYYSAFWSNGCVAVIEKWVQSGFAQPKEFIIKTLIELDIHLEKLIVSG